MFILKKNGLKTMDCTQSDHVLLKHLLSYRKGRHGDVIKMQKQRKEIL